MEFNLTMESMQFNCKIDEAIAMLQESMNQFDIKCQEIALAEMQDSVLTESAGFLYEDAADTANNANKGILGTIISTITGFIKKIIDKIRAFFTSKKATKDVENIKDAIEKDPSLGNKKIEMIDLNALTDRQKKYFGRMQKILAKQEAGEELSSSEMRKLDEWMNDECGKIKAKKIVVPVTAALAAVGGALAYCKASNTTLGELGNTMKNNATKTMANVKAGVQNKVEDIRYNAALKDAQEKNKSQDKVTSEAAERLRTTKAQCESVTKKWSEEIAAIQETINNMEAAVNGIRNQDSDEYRDANEKLGKEQSRLTTAKLKAANEQREADEAHKKAEQDFKQSSQAARNNIEEVERTHAYNKAKITSKRNVTINDANDGLNAIRKAREDRRKS